MNNLSCLHTANYQECSKGYLSPTWQGRVQRSISRIHDKSDLPISICNWLHDLQTKTDEVQTSVWSVSREQITNCVFSELVLAGFKAHTEVLVCSNTVITNGTLLEPAKTSVRALIPTRLKPQ